MEGAPVTAATGALGPVISKLAALLGSEYKLRWRTWRDVKFIRSKLEPVHSILWNIWEREELDEASKALKMDALDLADDVQDTIVDFILSMERSLSTKRLVQTKIKASPFHDFKKRASDVSGRCRSKWKENKKPAVDDSSPGKPRAYSFVRKDASELVGMARPRDKLIKYLVGQDGRTSVELRLKKAFIHGTAGMGKTTLANLVNEAIGDKFQVQAFVSVTPRGNMREVLVRILQQVAPNSSVPLSGSEATEEKHLVDNISNFLKDKRYLVIIDDIWNWREWEVIMKSLPENNLGSKIVGTTSTKVVADKWNDDSNALLHVMIPEWYHGDPFVYKIGSENIPTKMVDMKADLVAEGFNYKHPIVQMCGGTPLAVLCMLSAVAQELEKQAQQGLHTKACDVQDEIAKHVKENGIQNTPGFEALVESLQLGYDDLPHHMLKTCLLYCSLYPADHVFTKYNLVRRWISEGFVHTEEEANGYFEELVNRGFMILFKSTNGRFGMQPVMRNFLRCKSRQDNFFTCSWEITSSYNNTCRIRRLCICSSSDAAADPLSALDWNHIRSLIVYEGIERVPLEKLEGVRVMDLCQVRGLRDHHLKDIWGLVRLKHLLGLDGDEIHEEIRPEVMRLQCLETFEAKVDLFIPWKVDWFAGLPTGNLQQLKTLEVKGFGIRKLPREIGELQQLQTLRLGGTSIEELPREVGRLQQLKTLDISHTNISVLPKEVGCLQQLRTLDMSHTEISVLPKEVGSLQQLRTLDISRTEISVLPKEVGSLQQLRTLDISRTEISVLPKEVGSMQELRTLDISGRPITVLPKEIGKLQQLRTLDISNTEISVLPKEVGSLQQLRTLDISRTEISVLPKEVGSMQELRTLDISGRPITVLPKEIGELQELKTLDISRTQITVLPKEIGKLQHLEQLLMISTRVAKIPREIGALKELKSLKLDDSITALPLEVCTLVELPECIHQALKKSDLVSDLAGEMLSFQKSGWEGGLVVGAKQMHIPSWIREHFNNLALLDIRICKLEEGGLKILREMPRLRELTLRFEVVPREPVVISSQGFATLVYLTVDSRVPRVCFQEGAMPMLEIITFKFQLYAGPPNKGPVGINHLTNLWGIWFECNEDWYGGGDSPCIRPTIDVVRKEAQELRLWGIYFDFYVCGRREEICKPPPSPPSPLEMGQQRQMEEEERSSGVGEIEEDIKA